MNDKLIRIIIADDHPVFRFGLRALVESQADMRVLAEAENGADSVNKVLEFKPDVVLMDINMEGLNGIEATNRIVEAKLGTVVLVISMFDDDTVFKAMQAGARGYLLKGVQGHETLRAIRAVANGEVIFSPGVAEQMMVFFGSGGKVDPKPAPFPHLSSREHEILELLAQGYTNPAIAEKLILSPKTIRNNVSNIFSKLHVATRGEAIVTARKAGLGKDE